MSKKSIIPKKKNYITGLKELTKWLFSRRDEKEVQELIMKYELDNALLKRLASYTYNYPHIVWYINKYMNSLYQKFDLISMLYTFGYLLDINQRNQAKKLFYIKSNDLMDKNKQKIKILLSEYFDQIYDKHCNDLELNFYYDLIHLNVITLDQVHKLDEFLNGGKKTIDLSFDDINVITNPQQFNTNVLDIYKPLPESIQNFCNDIKTEVLNRPQCQKCELFGKTTVIIDTNANDFEDIDIAFIGLNPGTEESKIGKPFVGKSGKLLREVISKLPANIKWVIGNVILCYTRNEKEIKDADAVINNCYDLFVKIFTKFPTKTYVPLGAKATSVFGIKESITSVSGKTFKDRNFTIIPLIHPSSAANYGQMDKFMADFKTIQNSFNTNIEPTTTKQMKKQTSTKPISNIEIGLPENISLEDLTFFDVREINDKIIKIFIDSNGKKQYVVEDYKMKFNVKYKNWQECNQITNEVDYRVEISGKEKSFIISKVREKLNQFKSIQ